MATSRAKRSGRPAGKATRARRGAAQKRGGVSRKDSGRRRRAARGKSTELPAWSDLAAGKGGAAPSRPAESGFVEATSTLRFAGLVLLLAAAFTLYVGHVHATQDLLADLEQVRRDNLRLHLKENRLRGAFDQATGPTVIYERARSLGLEEGIAYGPTIRVDPREADRGEEESR